MTVKIKGWNRVKRQIKQAVDKVGLSGSLAAKKQIINNLKDSKKTGALSKSFKIKKLPDGDYVIESDLPYAAIQNYGGRIEITDSLRNKMYALFKETGLQVYFNIYITKNTHITIPAKNYLNIKGRAVARFADLRLNKNLNKIR